MNTNGLETADKYDVISEYFELSKALQWCAWSNAELKLVD
jgi:hypothetical protein